MLKKFLLFLFLLFSIYYLRLKPSSVNISPQIVSPQLTVNHQPSTISLIAVGDIMLGRNVNAKMQKYQNFTYPFEKTAGFLSSGNITFGNLESPFYDTCPIVGTGTMKFCADYKAIEGLKFAGFDILSLENNHIGNYGKAGIRQTIELLKQNEILPSTAKEITIKQVNNLTFGFLSWDLTINRDRDKSLISDKIKEGAEKADILIVSLHWGEEYQSKPTLWQVKLAHELIEAGAKVILGHHSHVIGEIESYKNGLIFYSLGNFVFDQMWSQQTREGLVAKINFQGKEIKDYQTYQVLISDYSQPDFLTSP